MERSQPHASGFSDTNKQQPGARPMRVMRVLDQIHIEFDIRSFVAILFMVCHVVRRDYPTLSVWHATDVVVEVLKHISELEPLNGIFQSSAEHALKQLNDRARVCQCLLA